MSAGNKHSTCVVTVSPSGFQLAIDYATPQMENGFAKLLNLTSANPSYEGQLNMTPVRWMLLMSPWNRVRPRKGYSNNPASVDQFGHQLLDDRRCCNLNCLKDLVIGYVCVAKFSMILGSPEDGITYILFAHTCNNGVCGPTWQAAMDEFLCPKEEVFFLRCAFCNEPRIDTLMQQCSRCKGAYYCNGVCQHAHWPTHRLQCHQHTAENNE